MAEGFLKKLDSNLQVFSAGPVPSSGVHPLAIEVMKEKGIDISQNFPKHVERFLNEPFDFVITVCDEAKETCPVFYGEVKERLHISFEDPAKAKGNEEKVLEKFREVRDLIFEQFEDFYNERIIEKV